MGQKKHNDAGDVTTTLALPGENSIVNLICMLEIKGEMNPRKSRQFKEVASLLSGASSKKVKTEKELRTEKCKEHIKDLIDNSSLHGLSYIFDKRHPIRRVVWFFITVSAFIYSMLKVYESTVNHFSFPFNTARMRQYVDEMDFPAVSFCNINDLRMSVLNGTAVDNAILHNEPGNVTAEEYTRTFKSAAHEVKEMLVDCEFDGQKCSTDNFTQFNWMQGDRCFTFNSGKVGHKLLKLDGSGVERSLSLTINVQHYDYYRDRMVSGIHLMLHGQDETPVRIRGPMISPGYTTYIQIGKKKVFSKSLFKVKYIATRTIR